MKIKLLAVLTIATAVIAISVLAQAKFRTITIQIPDWFTASQEAFIKKSVVAQIESEIMKTLKVPDADLKAAQTNVDALLVTNSLPAKYTNATEVEVPPK